MSLTSLWRHASGMAVDGLLSAICPICGAGQPLQRGKRSLCPSCLLRFQLPDQGVRGATPLPWWGSGLYAGALRELLLQLRRAPRARTVAALTAGLAPAFSRPGPRPLLIAIPGWKRRGNPLPGLLCSETARRYGLRQRVLLERSHPVLGQHHLNRRQRLANQRGAFRCLQPPRPGESRRQPLLIVDDILTTGATACSAAQALHQAGWRVSGLLCLARTPAPPWGRRGR